MNETSSPGPSSESNSETDSPRDEPVTDSIGDADATVPMQPLQIDEADRVLGGEPSEGSATGEGAIDERSDGSEAAAANAVADDSAVETASEAESSPAGDEAGTRGAHAAADVSAAAESVSAAESVPPATESVSAAEDGPATEGVSAAESGPNAESVTAAESGPAAEDVATAAEGVPAADSVPTVAAPKPSAIPNDALREELEAAVAALQGDEPPPPRRVKREPPPIPEIPGVPPEQVMKALAAVWKEATDRETPTFRQTLEEGVVRVDVDAVAGYLSVTTESDSHRAIGVRRDMVAPLVAALTARTVRDVDTFLAKGPSKIPSALKPAQNG